MINLLLKFQKLFHLIKNSAVETYEVGRINNVDIIPSKFSHLEQIEHIIVIFNSNGELVLLMELLFMMISITYLFVKKKD